MAAGTPIFFSKIGLLISNGATPAVFEAWCGITGLTKTSNKETGTLNMPDCDDPDLPGWLLTYLISNQLVIGFTGTAARESFQDFENWDRTGDYRTVRLVVDIDAADGGGYYEGEALLTQWEMTAENRAPWSFTGQVTFNGQPTWVPLT